MRVIVECSFELRIRAAQSIKANGKLNFRVVSANDSTSSLAPALTTLLEIYFMKTHDQEKNSVDL